MEARMSGGIWIRRVSYRTGTRSLLGMTPSMPLSTTPPNSLKTLLFSCRRSLSSISSSYSSIPFDSVDDDDALNFRDGETNNNLKLKGSNKVLLKGMRYPELQVCFLFSLSLSLSLSFPNSLY